VAKKMIERARTSDGTYQQIMDFARRYKLSAVLAK
jgi:hypothetical protein